MVPPTFNAAEAESASGQRLLTQPPLHRAAVVVTLVPCCKLNEPIIERQTRVVLQWIDSRHDVSMPLATLIQQSPLPQQLRDLVEQFSSRLLTETLLRSDLSAKLFHKCWQLRQREVDPLICSIAMSIRGILCNATNHDQFAPLLRRLGFSHSSPSVIAIANHLTNLDLAANPPVALPIATGERRDANQRHDRLLPDEGEILCLDTHEENEILTEMKSTTQLFPHKVVTTGCHGDNWMLPERKSNETVNFATVFVDDMTSDFASGVIEPPSDPEIVEPLDPPQNEVCLNALLSDYRGT